MNRSLKLSVLLALAVGSGQAAALELGQIQVKSALGQPLLAEIPLNPEHPSELQNLSAKLASSDEFARAGISGGAPNLPLQFSVVDGGNGRKFIRITSSAPVNDPYLDLLVEVDSASGKSVREFTILLDPPNAPAAAPVTRAPTQAPATSSKPSRRAAAPVPAADEQAAAPKPAPKPVRQAAPAATQAGPGQFGPVERGQTLSGIAKQTAPAGVDINQMLVALKQANPDAFYRDNINALKSGAVLRVPSREDAQAMAAAAAVAEVRRQNSDWRSGAARTPTSVADAGTRASASTAPSSAKSDNGDRLALVPSKDGQGSEAGAGKGDKGGKGMAGLHQDLLRSQEALASLEQQGDELKSRLKDLEDINTKNAKLLSLKDNEIAELQGKLSEARKSAGKPAEPVAAAKSAASETAEIKPAAAASAAKAAPSAEPTLAVTPAGASTAAAGNAPAHAGTVVTAPLASTPVAEPAKPAVKPPVAKPAPAPAPEEPWYTQTWALAAGGGAAVLLLLGALLGRRRKAAPAVAAAASSSSLADRFGATPAMGNIDPDQDELLDQLAEHPDDVGLHLELVSLYYSRRDVDHFEAAAEAMHAHISGPDQPEWQDVVHMGEDLVPGHPLFAREGLSPLPPQNEDEHEALDHFDLGHYAGDGSDIPPIPAAPVPSKSQKVSEYHFDFDLTPRPLNGNANASASVAEPEHHESATSWQFADLEDERPAEPAHDHVGEHLHDTGEFSDDPADTKLDLARAYLDMGDPDGARAMLEEVLHEGSQMQKEVAKKLLESIR
ncbi:pilus assembly protein FimV [Dyella sp. OK004]|uniref:FimV/HubP family polar landmark protein n=1 Tax=Dyella sp. OK004 TaxID=1855292 RepID=UPI0008E5154E|nr:FimV/HubP family polar landmark protein [Dyella sp. OK004]SFS03099.1 pilus assembly protein FimV [Dyella sp. OK004]